MARSIKQQLIVENAADVRRGVVALRRICPTMRRVHDLTGDPPLRRFKPGFEGLARIVVGQQLSTASAGAIWQRTFAAVRPFRPNVLLALSDAQLQSAGLSRPKIRTLRTIANAIVAGELDLARLAHATDDAVRGALTEINGLGPWSADIYLMFCLGRADCWAPGDLALQLAVQSALALDARPSSQDLDTIAERWRPWRAIAAGLMWAYYAHARTPAEPQPKTRGTLSKKRQDSMR